MAKETDLITVNGEVIKVLPATMYRVKLANGPEILGHISGKMRRHFIKITTGDKVTVEISPTDLPKGRITFREKTGRAGGRKNRAGAEKFSTVWKTFCRFVRLALSLEAQSALL